MAKPNDLLLPPLDERSAVGRRRITLLLCFALPTALMAVLYAVIGVYPGSDRSVLVLDLNAQYIYYFEQFREIIRSGETILYSFKRALGGEFMGVFAYYLASPFSLIVALFPKDRILDAMELILVLKCGCTGLAFGYFIDEKVKTRRSLTVLFSVLYALTSFAVVMQHNVMWTDNLIAFPLILSGLDALIERRKFRLFTVSLAYAVASNFYIGYMACLFVLVWFFARYFMLTPGERNPMDETAHFVKSLLRVALWSAAAVAAAGVILLPTVYSLSFGKLEFSTPDWKPKQLFEFLDILTKSYLGSYDTVRPTGMPFLYCGTVALVLSPLFFVTKSIPRRRKAGFAAVMLFLFVSFNFSPLDIIWHGMQRPNWLNARFAYMFTALALWMAAEALVRIREIGKRAPLVSASGWSALLLICSKIGYEHLPTFKSVWPQLLCLVLAAFLIPPLGDRKRTPRRCAAPPEELPSDSSDPVEPTEPEEAEADLPLPDEAEPRRAPRSPRPARFKQIAALSLCVFAVLEAAANGILMMVALDEDVSYSTNKSYRQMISTYEPAVALYADKPGFFRSEKLVHRKKNDNFALGIRGMSNSTSTLNARAVELLGQFGYAAQSHWSMYAGATAVTDALFGIRYVMADETDDKPVMSYIHDLYDLIGSTDTHIDVYENPWCLSLAYATDPSVVSFGKSDAAEYDEDLETYTDPFTYMNKLLSAMTGKTVSVWRRAELMGIDTVGCDLIFATGHKGYQKTGSGGASVIFSVSVDSSAPLYCYFPSKWPREASLMLNGSKIGKYFDGEDFSIRELGCFAPGEIINASLVMKKDEMYIRSGVPYFWYFDEDAFKSAIEDLKSGVMAVESERDDELFGTVTVPAGRELLFTTIPFDEGWQVTVDGREYGTTAVLNDTLLAVRIPAGEHEVRFAYRPACVRNGWALTVAGSLVFIAGCLTEGFVPIKRKRKLHD
ncbi:MAG: hypothetical protein E7576_07495 [Ruminococcaceae bacterium]|jgi:uncharacterized membrane protein YfhO|nr:hypothetical protein [Oscillospiraceae bacterium]